MAVIRNIKRNKKILKFLEYLMAWEIVAYTFVLMKNNTLISHLNGGTFITLLKNIVLVVTCFLLWSMKSNRKFKLSQFILPFFMISWMFFVSVINNTSIHKLILPIWHCTCAFLLVQVLDFKKFRELLLNAMNIISAISLIMFMLYLAGVIGTTSGNIVILYLFKIYPPRLASIYQEPGYYQIMLFLILLLFVDELVKFKFTKYYIKKFGIIIAAILASQSSMGYICLGVFAIIIFFYNKSIKHNFISYVILLTAGIAGAFLLWQSETVQLKIASQNGNYSSSFQERTADTIVLFRMSMIQPLTGLGRRSPAYMKYHAEGMKSFYRKAEEDSSGINGVLNIAVCFGWPFFFLIVWLIVAGIKKMKPGVPPMLVAFVLLLSLCDESYALNVLTWLYILPFNSYNGQEEISS